MTPAKIGRPRSSPKAPKHLAPATRAWFRSVVADWTLEQHHVRLLTLAAGAWDRAEQARQAIAKDGLCITTRLGEIKAHPGVAVERDSRLAFARLIRELDLDVAPPSQDSRPPRLKSQED